MTILGVLGEGLAELTVSPTRSEADLGVGGDAANIAVMAARLGAAVRLCGRVGDDGLGRALVRHWVGAGVDVTAVRTDEHAATGLYLNEDALGGGHRFVYWRRGSAGSRLAPTDVTDGFATGLSLVAATGVTLAISPTARAAALAAIDRVRAAGGRVAFVVNHRPVLDPPVSLLAAVAVAADIVVGSREDFAALFGASDPDTLRAALADGPGEVVVTDEDRPALAIVDDAVHRQPVPRTAVVNAAGAGDALAGAYLAGRLAGLGPAASLRQGVVAASLSVASAGCARSYPSGAAVAAALAIEGAPA